MVVHRVPWHIWKKNEKGLVAVAEDFSGRQAIEIVTALCRAGAPLDQLRAISGRPKDHIALRIAAIVACVQEPVVTPTVFYGLLRYVLQHWPHTAYLYVRPDGTAFRMDLRLGPPYHAGEPLSANLTAVVFATIISDAVAMPFVLGNIRSLGVKMTAEPMDDFPELMRSYVQLWGVHLGR